jgi:hypothetical protein
MLRQRLSKRPRTDESDVGEHHCAPVRTSLT